ncbi:DUF4287 domain-containing protein [Streptomyces sp. AGS-58]|uniref:DUF4287 domain-containing protein n=1 Tax=unclassified Streptomyces TaxID=2593676 RepID=UPI0035A37BD1
MTEKAVKGPASYFPSAEWKYGRPVGERQEVILSSSLTGRTARLDRLGSEHGLGPGRADALVAAPLAGGE